MGQRIAVIGTGIAGLGAAWALSRQHDVTVYEQADRIGGHSNTVDVIASDGLVSVDTGFIVYNEITYPHLTRLFSWLGVPTQPSDMSFAFSRDRQFEYAASIAGVLAKPGNLTRPRFIRMLLDINRFRREGDALPPNAGESMGGFLHRNGYGDGFIEDYLLPMTGAIWSSGNSQMLEHPAQSILRFMGNHGLIEVRDRPAWRTVQGGSRSYVERLSAPFSDRILLDRPVTQVERTADGVMVATPRDKTIYDHVVLAVHTDQALRLLGTEATEDERRHLSAIPYRPNVAVLHGDPDLMPRNRSVWSSWNAMADTHHVRKSAPSVTYWMNRLQDLDTDDQLFISLNPTREPDPGLVHGRYRYSHPQFGPGSVGAQTGLARIQGQRNTWYAGAYLGYGFHEDGLQSGLNVAAALGSPAPWQEDVVPQSSAPSFAREMVAI